MTANPWVDRFLHLNDLDVIRDRVRVSAIPLVGLHSQPVGISSDALRKGMERLFMPTVSVCTILQTMLAMALSHSRANYPDMDTFLRRCQRTQAEHSKHSGAALSAESCRRALLLTGPPGTGKTTLLRAYFRCFTGPSSVVTGNGYPDVPIHSGWIISAAKLKQPTAMLKGLISQVIPDPKGSSDDLLALAENVAYQLGIPILLPDEFQFSSASSNSNAQVTSCLLRLLQLDLPMLFVANYSLIHKVKRRPAEDKQRLLSHPLFNFPDLPDSIDWVDYLAELKKVAPTVFLLDPSKDSLRLHLLCGGLRRLLIDLLIIGYQIARSENRHEVSMKDTERAYLSPQYSINREDVEVARNQIISGKPGNRPDLWCPFDLEQVQQHRKAMRLAMEARQATVAEDVRKSGLTAQERQVEKTQEPPKLKVVSSGHRTNRQPKTPDSLLDNAARLRRSREKAPQSIDADI